MKVHELMTAHARCVGPDNTLVEAAGLMRQHDIGAVPVCDNDRLAGMLTDRDIAVRAVADGRDPNTTTVREAMSPGVIFVLADQDVEEVVRVMEQRQVRRLPVLNRAKKLVGIISLGDIAVASNPAFSGLALREVSESEQTLSHRGAREAIKQNGRVSLRGPAVPATGSRGRGSRAAEGKEAARSAKRARSAKTSSRTKSKRSVSRPARAKAKGKRGRSRAAAR